MSILTFSNALNQLTHSLTHDVAHSSAISLKIKYMHICTLKLIV